MSSLLALRLFIFLFFFHIVYNFRSTFHVSSLFFFYIYFSPILFFSFVYTFAIIKLLTSSALPVSNSGRDSEVVILYTKYSQKTKLMNLETIYFITKQRAVQVKIGILLREIASVNTHQDFLIINFRLSFKT
jgi:hypothetical protein